MKTKRVKIAVAINQKGHWIARGKYSENEEWSSEVVSSNITGGAIHWIEADIPIPESTTVEGRVG